jgi:hypothetical protein
MEGIKYLWPISEAAEHTKQSQSNVQVFGTLSIHYLTISFIIPSLFLKSFYSLQRPVFLYRVGWNNGFTGNLAFKAGQSLKEENILSHLN